MIKDTGDGLAFEVKGLKELDEFLKGFPEKVQRKCIASAAFAGAAVWREAAKDKVPMRSDISGGNFSAYQGPIRMGKGSLGRLPGYLRQHIRVWKKRARANAATVTYGVGTRGWAFYGKFLEFGTSKMAARPWLRPAVDRTTGQALEAMRARLQQRIMRYILKGK